VTEAASDGRPLASVSLDLDNQWSYMKTHGDPGWEAFPSYLDVLVPHALDALADHRLKITFFVVGQDAALEKNHAALALLDRAGHEIGNHSFHHEQWMGERTPPQIERELTDASEAIKNATGQEPRGYRGPGFTWSRDLLEILERTGYLYDASTLPTYIGPLARLYYFRTSSLDADERGRRKDLFGGFSEGRRSIKPYLWGLGSDRRLLEIPVTTMPWIKTPFHLSYLLYLGRHSHALMSGYLKTALRLCRWSGIEPSFLIHPLDLLGPEQAPELAFFPAMDLSSDRKRAVFDTVLGELGRHFRLVPLGEHAGAILERDLPVHAVPEVRLAVAGAG
jgi:hypothetical protein